MDHVECRGEEGRVQGLVSKPKGKLLLEETVVFVWITLN